MKLTKEEALKKIEELKKYVENEEKNCETKKVKLEIRSWSGAVLFESEKTTQREAIMDAVESGANLRNANLYGSDLCGADLCGADLCNADLRDANLRGANLRNANLYGSDLCGADLCNADLRDADLRGAELENVKFYGKGGTKPLKRNQLPDFLAALGFIIED